MSNQEFRALEALMDTSNSISISHIVNLLDREAETMVVLSGQWLQN